MLRFVHYMASVHYMALWALKLVRNSKCCGSVCPFVLRTFTRISVHYRAFNLSLNPNASSPSVLFRRHSPWTSVHYMAFNSSECPNAEVPFVLLSIEHSTRTSVHYRAFTHQKIQILISVSPFVRRNSTRTSVHCMHSNRQKVKC